MSGTISRRGFLVSLSAAGVVTVVGAGGPGSLHAAPGALEPNVFVRVDPDGTVTIKCHRAEMGQGVRSTLPWIIAAELGADYGRVVVEQARGDARYGNQNTDGSRSIRKDIDKLRRVGATAREMLVAAAAARWGVGAEGLRAEGHRVTNPDTDMSLGFGELAEDAAGLAIPQRVRLRPAMAHLGRPMPAPDLRPMVRGTAKFGADLELPGMLFAVVRRPPDVQGSVDSVDDTAARSVPGVVHVLEMRKLRGAPMFQPLGGVAVVATNTWAAMRGRDALDVVWKLGANAGASSAEDLAILREAVQGSGKPKRVVGDADRVLAEASQTVTATYTIPHLAHVPMEPPACVVWVQRGQCEVWAPVQAPQRTRNVVAAAVGLPPHAVTVNQTLLGGGFGRKSKPDFVAEAAWLSKKTGKPIRLQWDRTDDVRHGYYHACSAQRLDAGFDGGGRLVAWRHRLASPTILSTFLPATTMAGFELGMGPLDLGLDVPNVRVEVLPARSALRVGWMRAVQNVNSAFAIQSFVDELARVRGVSAPEMLKTVLGPPRVLTEKETGGRLQNYGHDSKTHPIDIGRWHSVIDDVVARSDYEAGGGEGVALGFSAHASFGTYVAAVVALRDEDGRPRLDEVWVSVDAGQIMNPDRAHAQMEGAVVFGASIALHGEITYADGAVQQSNFHDFPVLRMNESPRAIHVEFVSSGGLPGGIGEPGVPPIAPAIANAWHTLTGVRRRDLPLRGA